jgi:hypothetical protein
MRQGRAAHQEDWRTEDAVLITRVLAVDRHDCGLLVALTDRRLDDAPVNWSRARLVNRVSRARRGRSLLVRRPSTVDIVQTTDVILVSLPGDLRMGDLLAIPSRIPVAAGEPHARLRDAPGL